MSISTRKTLFISYDGMTDPLGQSQVIPYLSGLSDAGIEVSLLSFEKKERYDKNSTMISKILADKRIKWTPLFYTKKPPVLSTLYDVSRLIGTAERLYNENKFDVIHCRSYISALAGLRLKRKYGVKFIFDMRGFWADERVEGKIWDLKNPLFNTIYKYFKKKEREFLEEADYTISLTEHARDVIHSWKNVKGNPVPIQVIPCCADLSHFDYHLITEAKKVEFKKSLGIGDDDFIVSYLGSIGTWYMLDEMLDFYTAVLEKKPNAKFLFITPDEPKMILEAAAKKNIGAKNFIIRSAQRAEVPLYLSMSQLSFFFVRPTFSKIASSPTKQGEIMGMGIPLICNSDVGDTDRIVEDTGCGVIIKKFTKEEYATVLSHLDEVLAIAPEHIRVGAEKYYSLQNGVKKYLFVYESLLK